MSFASTRFAIEISEKGRTTSDLAPDPQCIQPKSKWDWGVFIYGGAIANLVLRDLTLDGNTSRYSPSIDRNFFVPAASIPLAP